MAITKRKDILDQIVYLLGQIREANGYSTDINSAARQRDTENDPFAPEECWAANVLDGRAETEHLLCYEEHRLPVTIELHATSRVTVADAETALADLVACVEANDTWGGHADGTDINSHEVNILQVGDTITAVIVELVIRYTTDKGKI